MRIGNYQLDGQLLLAPMAGITDRPFRTLCREYGAALATSEMVLANPDVWQSDKSQKRIDYQGESGIRSVQIAGADPELMAQTAQFNVEQGAQIIDINMGCPAKKVNKKLAGSALLQDPALVRDIVRAVVNAVNVPVTLKIRTGWNKEQRNGTLIAQIAQDEGISALAVHGRTRACLYNGDAEYDHIKAIKQLVNIPVSANGDITSAEKARFVLDYTGVDALMIGRGAQGRPWLFNEINHYLRTGESLAPPPLAEQAQVIQRHVMELHQFYGAEKGLRVARKHVGWYCQQLPDGDRLRQDFIQLTNADTQLDVLAQFFSHVLD